MTNSVDLLKSLGSGVRPAGVEPSGVPAVDASGGPDFTRMLEDAQRGQLRTGQAVSLAPESGVQLTSEQLVRLSAAADQAEAAGMGKALVMIDGKALMLDVGMRKVTGAISFAPGQVVPGIDGIVVVPGAGEAAAKAAKVPPPSSRTDNASLAQILNGSDAQKHEAA